MNNKPIRRIRKKHLNSLEREINHCIERIKADDCSPNERHYALGRLEVLQDVYELSLEYREEMRRFWVERAVKGDLYYSAKDSYHTLNNLFVPEKK